MNTKSLALLGLMVLLLISVACSPASDADAADADHEEGEHTHSPEDHMDGAHGVPAEASAVLNPVATTEESVEMGQTIFATTCAVCHGEEGRGDGPGAEGLDPKPADLNAGHVQDLSDGGLFYIVSHGKPETPMPAWDSVLSEDERWNLINFLRTFGGDDNDDNDHHEEGDDHHDESDDHHEEGDDHHDESDDHHEEGDDHHDESDDHHEEGDDHHEEGDDHDDGDEHSD